MLEMFNRSPWQRNGVISLQGPRLSQASEQCEMTAEGGLRCADGTYYPPGCEPGSPEAVEARPLVQDFPVVPVILIAAGAAVASAVFLSGEEAEAMSKVQEFATSIEAERAADAWNHQQYISRKQELSELLEKERLAQAKLSEEERRWESTHLNAAELQAAQNELSAITDRRTILKAEADDFRGRVDDNAKRILYYRQEAFHIISSMPEASQTRARQLIDPCYQPVAMKGPMYQVVNYRR